MVFTGTVEKLYRSRSSTYRGVVKVKRVVKGDSSFSDNTVIVEGFGDPNICHSDVRERDTRIFLVSLLDNGHLRLNSSVVRVTVSNLDKAVEAVKGAVTISLVMGCCCLVLPEGNGGKLPDPGWIYRCTPVVGRSLDHHTGDSTIFSSVLPQFRRRTHWGCQGTPTSPSLPPIFHVMSSIPVPLKTRRVGQRCTLNLSRVETSSRWCGVVVRRGGCQLRCRPRHLTMVQNYVVRRQKPSCS
ncbi:ntA domain-containing protein [Trichonephila clavipes]|nr:ntA domain-containing protein [Trichonephila clavipes]